jgi:hypothetical protein
MEPCPSCRGEGTEWYQARDGEYVQAACSTCGDGLVNGKAAGTVSAAKAAQLARKSE